ncbi:beta-lactamase family protein [Metarhizium rileyi]|uniref:Beta-lactamase family protein n=1 Tax=Metarhizium rileyi (strain RCEF 4871) TaxID=1649241 RepID=A0A167AVV9_METRR|nr:beta-lactamase family protein [Metarhizium rileyi RCEF 4871]
MDSQHSPGMESVDLILQSLVNDESRGLHNACFLVMGKERTLYSKAVGWQDVGRTQPVALDSFFWIASLTKLSTAVATLIAVEKGLVTLDQNVRDIVPELACLDVLEGVADDGTPCLKKCTAPISLRGFCYDKQHEGLQRWATHVGKKEDTFTGSYSGYLHPLIFEPGQGWAYGPGFDWAGRTIEVVSGQDLESFMQANMWTPLGMDATTFWPKTRPDLEAKLVDLAWRGPDGHLTKGKNPFGPAVDCCGGVGLFSTPDDQAKLLSALLTGGAGIISQESIDELLRPQTQDPSHFVSVVCGTNRAHLGQTWPEGSQGDFGLSSSINTADFPRRRAANSANWQGMPGVHAVR